MFELSVDPPPSSLVAETRYLNVVEVALKRLGLNAKATQPNRPELGLTRLELTSEIGDLDAVLAELRRQIAADHGGWTPDLGKDRDAASTAMRGGHPKPTSLLLPQESSAEEAASVILHPAAPVPGSVRVGVVDTADADLSGGGEAWRAHSAFVASIVRSAAPGVDLRSVPALSLGNGKGSTWDVASAIVDLGFTQQVQIVLLPLACFTADGRPPMLLERAINCLPPEILVIAAAGNQIADPGWSTLGRGPASAAWPAALASVRAVSADFSQTEDPPLATNPQPWVDAVAAKVEFVGPFFDGLVHFNMPGEPNDPGTTFNGSAKWRGTSFSAAHAAGLVAALMNNQISAHAAWDALLAEGTDLRPPVPESVP